MSAYVLRRPFLLGAWVVAAPLVVWLATVTLQHSFDWPASRFGEWSLTAAFALAVCIGGGPLFGLAFPVLGRVGIFVCYALFESFVLLIVTMAISCYGFNSCP